MNVLPADPEHTDAGPVIIEAGSALTVTVLVQVELQVVVHFAAGVVVSVSVKVPVAPALTVTEEQVVDPEIVPFPLMLQT